jgi:hypothetical protein
MFGPNLLNLGHTQERKPVNPQVYNPQGRVRLYEASCGVLRDITGQEVPHKLKA